MQAVIIAAGKSTRTYPLTENRHKALLPLMNIPLLESTLNNLKTLPEINSVVIIVGHMKDEIMDHFALDFNGLKISYVFQNEQKGTGHALALCENFIKDDEFICMYGDDLYSIKDIKKLVKIKNGALVKKVDDPSRFGVFVQEKMVAKDLVEKPKKFISDLANIGVYKFTKDIFDYLKDVKKSPRGEIELTDAVFSLMKKEKFILKEVKDYWIPLAYPWDLLIAHDRFMKQKKKDEIKGTISKKAKIKGRLVLGTESIIEDGVFISGNVSIGKGCVIGRGSKITDSIIMDGTKIGSDSEIKSSIIAENCVVSENVKMISENKRGKIFSFVKGKKVDISRETFGCAVGDNVNIKSGAIIFPGVKISSGKTIKEKSRIKKDI
ncbi:MAG: sugar phosphate nucleotidyltransferase [Candidatus Woesearchaeota archaeon]